MEWKSYLKKFLIDFLMIQAGITLSIGIIGTLRPPELGVTHTSFFVPFVYAFFCVLPSVVTYSAKELGVKQMLLRKVIQFVLIELVVLTLSYLIGTLNSASICIAIAAAVAVIYAAVNLLEYLFYKSDADAMMEKIRLIKERERNNE